MADEVPRSRRARAAAENALVRVVHHYGERPEFVVLGGLVPDWLCSGSAFAHAGTTDIDVQVDLEIAAGSVRLERALRNAEFEPEGQNAWRWVAESPAPRIMVSSSSWPISTTPRIERSSCFKGANSSAP